MTASSFDEVVCSLRISSMIEEFVPGKIGLFDDSIKIDEDTHEGSCI